MLRSMLTALLVLAASPAAADFVGGLNPYGDNFLALRTGPGTQFPMVDAMGPGTHLVVLAAQGGWRYVALDDGRRGWAAGRYILPEAPRPSPPAPWGPPGGNWGGPPPPPPGGGWGPAPPPPGGGWGGPPPPY